MTARISRSQRQTIGEFIGLLPRNAAVLDAACGDGAYWQILLDAGCEIVGIDESIEALNRAHQRYPDVATQRCRLLDMPFTEAFDGVLCVDALGSIPRADVPGVLCNIARALRPGCACYLTLEQGVTPRALDETNALMRASGLRIIDERHGDGSVHVLARRSD